MLPTADCGSVSVEHPGWNVHANKAKKNAAIRRRVGARSGEHHNVSLRFDRDVESVMPDNNSIE